MKGWTIAGAVLALTTSSAANAERPVQGTGFVCTGDDSAVKRINIDLKRKRWDEGDGLKELDSITDTKITLRGINPFLASGENGGMGPVFSSLTLDRASLILHDDIAIPNRGVNRKTEYLCQMGAPVDFTAGRQF